MSSVKLQGNASGSGSVTLASPNTNNNQTISLPDATTTMVGTDATQTLTNKTLTSPTLTSPTISGTPVMSASVITSGTSQASTSGTAIDFTGLPSWVKRITVMFNGVSTSGSSFLQIQIGSGSFTTSGYLGAATSNLTGSGFTVANFSAGYLLEAQYKSATSVRHGAMTIVLQTGNTWVITGMTGQSDALTSNQCAGLLALSGTLDRVRITTVNGTDTFDAGSINILYE